jgi:hypothetical protein
MSRGWYEAWDKIRQALDLVPKNERLMGVIPINSRVAATFPKNLKRGIFIATGTRRHSMAAIVTSGVQLQSDPPWAVAI